jgi:hypothetical protein
VLAWVAIILALCGNVAAAAAIGLALANRPNRTGRRGDSSEGREPTDGTSTGR